MKFIHLLYVTVLVFSSFVSFAQTANDDDYAQKIMKIENDLTNLDFESALIEIDTLLMSHQVAYLYKLKGDAISRHNDRFIVDSTMFKEALASYTTAIHMDTSDFVAVHSRAFLYFTHQYFAEAKNEIVHAFKLALSNEDKITILNLRGLVSSHLREYGDAISDFNEIIAIDPTWEIAYSNLSRIYMDLKDYSKAEGLIKEAMRINPSELLYGNNLGFIYLQSQQFEKAEAVFGDLMEQIKYPEPILLNNRGYARMKLGKWELAKNDIEKSIGLYSDNSFAFRNLALLQIEMGEKVLACENLEKAISLKFTETYGDEVQNLIVEHCKN